MKHYLSLCGIVKNEARYLEEWLRFYHLLGVEHFYLYDNESTDGTAELLKAWRAAGRATIYDVSGRAMQSSAYRQCIREHARDSTWIMFVDVDEFLFAPTRPDLRVFLQGYEAQAGVVANWVMFGASGHQRRPSGLTTLNYTRRCDVNLCTFEPGLLKSPDLDPRNPASYYRICDQIKTIVNTRDVTDIGISVHDFRYRDGRVAVNANGQRIMGPFSDDLSAIKLLRVNHYVTRSWEEFDLKMRRGRGDITAAYEVEAQTSRARLFDQVEDRDIYPLARRVEASLHASPVAAHLK